MSEYCAAAGKKGFEQYGDALEHAMRKPYFARIYICDACDLFHVTSTQLRGKRKKGRGKNRRGIVGVG